MRRIVLLFVTALVLALVAAPSAFAQANDQNCDDFNDINAGGHGDGVACQNEDYGGGGGDDGTGGGGPARTASCRSPAPTTPCRPPARPCSWARPATGPATLAGGSRKP